MKLLLIGAETPTAKEMTQQLQLRQEAGQLEFAALATNDLDPAFPDRVTEIVASYKPTQVINLAVFNSESQKKTLNAEAAEEACRRVNTQLVTALTQCCVTLRLPLVQMSSCYVFDGEKKLGYNEQDEPNPQGIYGRTLLAGERALQKHEQHILVRGGWLFGPGQDDQIEEWITHARQHHGELSVFRRRLSPTPTEDLARVILAICLQVDCGATVWGTYHYCGLETKKENEFVQQILKYAAQHDEAIYQMIDSITVTEKTVAAPEIANSTLSTKKIFDTFGVKQRSWHGSLQNTIRALYHQRDHNIHQTRDNSGVPMPPGRAAGSGGAG